MSLDLLVPVPHAATEVNPYDPTWAVSSDRRMLEPKSTWAFPHVKMMWFRGVNLISIIMTRAPDLFWAHTREDYMPPGKELGEAWCDGSCLTEKSTRAALALCRRSSKWRREICPLRCPEANSSMTGDSMSMKKAQMLKFYINLSISIFFFWID
jgi:hypothetical protein